MMNLPSVAGVLNFQNYANQLNNANAGVKNLVGMANDWAKMAAQNNQAEKQAQAQRDFTAEQNQINRDFQQQQQKERFEHELGMFDKQQERQNMNERRKFNQGLEESLTTPISDKYDTNAMTEQRLRNKVIEMKQHPEWFKSDEEYNNAIATTTRRANEVMLANKDIYQTNKFKEEFKDFDKDNFRNADDMLYWYSDNKDEIDRLDPSMEAKIYNAVSRKQAEEEDYYREQRGKRRSEYRDINSTNESNRKQSAASFVDSLR